MSVIEPPRLTLRRLETEDAPFILRLLNEPSFLEFIGDRGVRMIEQARDYVWTGPLASYELHGFGLYLVVEKGNGAPAGMRGLLKRDVLPEVDLGFAVGMVFEGTVRLKDDGADLVMMAWRGPPPLCSSTSACRVGPAQSG